LQLLARPETAYEKGRWPIRFTESAIWFVSSGFSNQGWSTFVFQIFDLINVGFSGLIRISGFNYSLSIGS